MKLSDYHPLVMRLATRYNLDVMASTLRELQRANIDAFIVQDRDTPSGAKIARLMVHLDARDAAREVILGDGLLETP